MNENHRRVCTSDDWAAYLQGEVLTPLAAIAGLGGDLLEIGPGPGAATEWLRRRVSRLVAVELDAEAAGVLKARYDGTNVEIVVGDATALELPDESFDAVGCFTMLHHVPTLAQQRAILAEAYRVLRPGGVLLGSDSLASVGLHEFHEGDTYNPIEPTVLLVTLRVLGFEELTLRVHEALSFVARKPSSAPREGCADEDEDRDERSAR